MKILFFTKYNELGPSSRYRVYQYIDSFEKAGIQVDVMPFFGSRYFTNNLGAKIVYTLYCYLRRKLSLLNVFNYDIIYVEYELFPYFPALFEKLFKLLKVKYIVDYDDAIFHHYNTSKNGFIRLMLSNKIDSVIKNASYVISGSPYLTQYISELNTNCVEIPTSVSSTIYHQLFEKKVNNVFTIGWIGSKTTSVNVLSLLPVFEKLSSKFEFQLNLIGFDEQLSSKLQHLNVHFIKWDAKTEIDQIKRFDVGIMPLENTAFNQGKCGFKLVQYMGCSLPTISSPLEANLKINRNKKNLHATSNQEWMDAFEKVYENQSYYREVGLANYNDFLKYYTIESNYERYIEVFKKLKSN
ncbi:glycosyltransferase family 4 protein [Flavobacterium cellulosilyticum]|uniref:Glycosyltransferase family 1 protein n=1 Tax=Flavobacterium cellulosilyticum TaxID=2541731 RepID=A0A4R5CIJ9_9FLAO|nr:glycosyltransferase family 4 protein [Flavobacterium cellulosilyticum]TDD98380.1 glycosyltransferase family 1 protein [Flavobacterium cellulosilyticum]